MRRLKLIWDFRGPDAKKIAEHHEIHLKEYFKFNGSKDCLSGVETISESHSIAYVVVDEIDMKPIRDALKPHRGQVYSK